MEAYDALEREGAFGKWTLSPERESSNADVKIDVGLA
jgi:hypothetical protein